ncbi:MAG: hypothetical protein JSR47_09150 [Proteobacteria bacterium]|nr:hypothetical protein [Pseudomonadota bacterium]
MRTVSKLSLAAALIGSVALSFSGAAQASDHWERDHGYYRHYDHGWHHGRDRIIERRVVERPVYVRERPVYAAPMLVAPPMYQQQQGPSGLNLNFNIPLN